MDTKNLGKFSVIEPGDLAKESNVIDNGVFGVSVSDPKLIDQLLTVSPGDSPKKLALDWCIYERQGCEIFKNGEPVTTENGIQVGDSVVTAGLWGEINGKIISRDGRLILESDSVYGLLEFAKDDRLCWICTSMINKKLLDDPNSRMFFIPEVSE